MGALLVPYNTIAVRPIFSGYSLFGFMSRVAAKDENGRTGSIFLNRRSFLIMGNTPGEASMTTWRTTVIMKTDIKSSTVRFRALPDAELDALLTEHRAFVSRLAAVHDGRIVKPEGDGFWCPASPQYMTAASSSRRAMGSGSSSPDRLPQRDCRGAG